MVWDDAGRRQRRAIGCGYSSVIKACAKSGDVPGAVKWLEALQSSGVQPTVVSYNSVIDSCAQSGDVPGAVTWLEALQQRSGVRCRRMW